MQGVYKRFCGIHAVERASCTLHAGEVVGLLGHNSAGKSALIELLSGVYPPDDGKIVVHGQERRVNTPREARAAGIETIHQTLALAKNLDAPSNLFLGRELLTPWRPLDADRIRGAAGLPAPEPEPHRPAQAGASDVRWPAADGGDRPRAVLQRARSDHGRALRGAGARRDARGDRHHRAAQGARLKEQGIGSFLISHDMADVFEVCDRATVMKNGQLVDTVNVPDDTQVDVLGMIILGQKPKARAV